MALHGLRSGRLSVVLTLARCAVCYSGGTEMNAEAFSWEYCVATCWNAHMGSVCGTDAEVWDFHCMMDMGGEL